ncbi:MAG: hypothetical protein LBF93_03020 [Zoogloeaceae bacterium]|jgi:hypothetical protein|nr:hypothetical protein [Zoogloeaceae bacterium]
MKINQLTRGQKKRIMYIENKDGLLDGVQARIGWVSFSKSGRTIYYKGRSLITTGGRGIRGNFMDTETHEEFWVSGVKKRGSNVHPAELASMAIDDDAKEEYVRLRTGAQSTVQADVVAPHTLVTYGGKYEVPSIIYHGVPSGWSKAEILAAHKAMKGTYLLDGPEATEPGAHSWMIDRYAWLQYRATLCMVINGIAANDHSCIELGIRYIELRHIGSYSGFIRARMAEKLRRASLSKSQKSRLEQHFLKLLQNGEHTEEFRQYIKLWRSFVSEHTRQQVGHIMSSSRLQDRRNWLIGQLMPNNSSKPTPQSGAA